MTDGSRILTIPSSPWRKSPLHSSGDASRASPLSMQRGVSPRAARHNPINAYTMGGIVRDAGLGEQRFRDLL